MRGKRKYGGPASRPPVKKERFSRRRRVVLSCALSDLHQKRISRPPPFVGRTRNRHKVTLYIIRLQFQLPVGGPSHGSELPYVFGAPLAPAWWRHLGLSFASAEVELSRRVMTYWTNFAAGG